ncbi:MAG: hypothetical protein B7Y88_15715, partial [Sphingomonadales bacterium 32-64-17]
MKLPLFHASTALGLVLLTAHAPSFAQSETSPPTPEADASTDAAGREAGTLDTIRSVTVAGSQRLEAQTILSYIQLRVGGQYTEAAADQALKDLYATELFANASIRNDNGN